MPLAQNAILPKACLAIELAAAEVELVFDVGREQVYGSLGVDAGEHDAARHFQVAGQDRRSPVGASNWPPLARMSWLICVPHRRNVPRERKPVGRSLVSSVGGPGSRPIRRLRPMTAPSRLSASPSGCRKWPLSQSTSPTDGRVDQPDFAFGMKAIADDAPGRRH